MWPHSEQVLEVEASLANITLTHGYSLSLQQKMLLEVIVRSLGKELAMPMRTALGFRAVVMLTIGDLSARAAIGSLRSVVRGRKESSVSFLAWTYLSPSPSVRYPLRVRTCLL